MFCHLIYINFKQLVALRTRQQHFFVKKCGCGGKIKFCGVKYAEKFWSFQNPFLKVYTFFLVNKNVQPLNAKGKKKNALKVHKQKTVWSYLVPTGRNLDFCGRGSLNFELSI